MGIEEDLATIRAHPSIEESLAKIRGERPPIEDVLSEIRGNAKILPSLEQVLAPYHAYRKAITPAEQMIREAAPQLAPGVVSGLTFGLARPGEPPVTAPEKIGYGVGVMTGAIPWIVLSEGMATPIVTRMAAGATISPLATTVLRATGAGVVYGGVEEMARRGPMELVEKPVEAAGAASRMGLAFGAFGTMAYYLGRVLGAASKFRPKPRANVGGGVAFEIERANKPQVNGDKIIEIMRNAREFGIKNINHLLTSEERAVLLDPHIKHILEESAFMPGVKWRTLMTQAEKARFGEAPPPKVEPVPKPVRFDPTTRQEIQGALPELVDPESAAMLPALSEPLKTMPTKRAIELRLYRLQRRRPKLSPDDVTREMKQWASNLTSEERIARYTDPEIKELGPTLRDIAPTEEALVDIGHTTTNVDPSLTLYQKMVIPFQRQEVRASVFAHKIKDNFHKKFNIKPKSAESAAMQRIGEGTTQPGDVKFNTPKMQKAIKSMREMYDWYLDFTNSVRASIGKMAIPKRKDYFTHFQELSFADQVYGGLNNIPPKYVVESAIRPNSPFFQYELRRLGEKYTEDAVTGFQQYTDAVSKVMFLAEEGTKLRVNAAYLPETLRYQLDNAVNYAYGVRPTGPVDRFFRKTISGRVMKWLAKRTVTNQVTGRLATAMVQSNSILFSISRAGPIKTMEAALDIVSPAKRAFARKVSPAVASHTLDFTDVSPTAMTKAGELVNWIVRSCDNEMSQIGFWAGWRQATKMGLVGETRIAHANRVVNSINATYLNSNVPSVLRTEVLKFMMPLQRQIFSLGATIGMDVYRQPFRKVIKDVMALELAGFGMNVIHRSIMQAMGLKESRTLWDNKDFIPLYWSMKFGFSPPALRAVWNLGAGTRGMITGKKGAERRLLKGGLMIVPPYGGKMMIDIMEGTPLGKEPK